MSLALPANLKSLIAKKRGLQTSYLEIGFSETPEHSETTILPHYCLGVPPESRIIGICEASCMSINITSRRSNWKNTAVFLPGITLLKSEMYLSRNSATD